MNDRRIEEHREMFLGEELVYYVVVIDPCPPPSDLDPYAPEGRCSDGGPIAARPVAPAPVVAKRVPTKAEYMRSFAAAVGSRLPEGERRRLADLSAKVDGVHRHFEVTGRRMPARLVRALAWYVAGDLGCAYDPSPVARIRHYFRDHMSRVARRHALDGAAL